MGLLHLNTSKSINTRIEINDIENRKTIEKTKKKTRAGLFEKINKIGQPFAGQSRGRKGLKSIKL